jgi:3'-5' exoribonuclease
VLEVAAIGRTIAKVSGGDEDLVLAGALLHDIGKLECYRWDGAFDYTDHGRLFGHVVMGALMFDRTLRAADPMPCTDDEAALIQHFILSHHGQLEFGAAVPPMTLEAEILHYADNASAKSASMADAVTDPENFTDDALVSTRAIWQLDKRRAYRGKFDWGMA